MFKVNNKDKKIICKICSKLTIATINWRQSVFVVNFEQIKKHSPRAFIGNFECVYQLARLFTNEPCGTTLKSCCSDNGKLS